MTSAGHGKFEHIPTMREAARKIPANAARQHTRHGRDRDADPGTAGSETRRRPPCGTPAPPQPIGHGLQARNTNLHLHLIMAGLLLPPPPTAGPTQRRRRLRRGRPGRDRCDRREIRHGGDFVRPSDPPDFLSPQAPTRAPRPAHPKRRRRSRPTPRRRSSAEIIIGANPRASTPPTTPSRPPIDRHTRHRVTRNGAPYQPCRRNDREIDSCGSKRPQGTATDGDRRLPDRRSQTSAKASV